MRGLRREAPEQVRQPGLAQAAGADDADHPVLGEQRPQPGHVLVAAHHRRRVVAQPLADRGLAREQLGVQAAQPLPRLGAGDVVHVRPRR